MRSNTYSSVNPENGNVTWDGPLSLEKGNHDHMPPRTAAYLPGTEKGHVNASSLGGNNTIDNIVPQYAEVNHGVYYSMEQGERNALQNGAHIDSVKTAVINGQPGDIPEAFLVSDHVTYSDGHAENIHFSFTNASYADQQAWNDICTELPGFDMPNPGDGLRESMSVEKYADLMESTDAALPSIADEYAATETANVSGELQVTTDDDSAASNDASTTASAVSTDASADDDSSAACDND